MVKSVFYLDNKGDWKITDNPSFMKAQEMFQRLQTFQGEKPFYSDDGIDYLGVFGGYVVFEIALQNIINDYVEFFENIEYNIIDEKESILVEMRITFKVEDNLPELVQSLNIGVMNG